MDGLVIISVQIAHIAICMQTLLIYKRHQTPPLTRLITLNSKTTHGSIPLSAQLISFDRPKKATCSAAEKGFLSFSLSLSNPHERGRVGEVKPKQRRKLPDVSYSDIL